MSPLAGQMSNAEKAYLHIRKGVCCKSPAKATGFTVGHKKSFEYNIPSPKIQTWVGFQLLVCLPKNVYASVQLVQWKPTPLSKDQWNQKKSSTGKPVSESKYFNVDSFHLADTRCTHKRESMDWTHIACLCLRRRVIFLPQKVTLAFLQYRRRRMATGECTWRLGEMLRIAVTWLTEMGSNNTHCRLAQKPRSRNTTQRDWDENRVARDRAGQVYFCFYLLTLVISRKVR